MKSMAGYESINPVAKNPPSIAPAAVHRNMEHPPRWTLLALAWHICAADNR